MIKTDATDFGNTLLISIISIILIIISIFYGAILYNTNTNIGILIMFLVPTIIFICLLILDK